MDIEQFIVAGAYVRVPADADLPTKQSIRREAAARGLMCLDEATPGPHTAHARAAIAEHQVQDHQRTRGIQRHNHAAFLDRLEDIAAAKVRVI